MKKILASVLAAASILTMTVSASATTTDKNILKPGEVTYDVAVTAPKVVLNLVMPAKMTAALNPYKADIKYDPDSASTTSKNTIQGIAYKVTNKSEDYGVYIDATAITTITTTDKKKADGSNAWDVITTAVADGTKNANMALIAGSTVAKIAPSSVPTASAAMTSSADGVLLLDSTVKADKTTGVAAGQTSLKKWAYAKASTGAGSEGIIYIGLTGKLALDDTTNKKEVVWNEDDAINVNLVLKVTAGPKTLT